MSADADDHRRWREIGDAIRTLNAMYDGPPPMAEITRIAEKHSAKPSDVLAAQRHHKATGVIEHPSDMAPYIRPRPVDLAGLDHIYDLPHEAPDGKAGDGRSMQVTCDRCGRQVAAAGIGGHQRGNRCIPPETAEPDTTVGASAPPAVAEDEPTPPADTPAMDFQWPEEFDQPGIAAAFGKAVAEGFEAGGVDVLSDDLSAELMDLATELAQDAGIAPLTNEEQAQASDMALVSDAVLALTMLGDQIPDVLRTQHGLALNHVMALHAALRDHHRNADLIAERAVLAARLAEIDAALAPVDDTDPEEGEAERVPAPAPEPEVGGGRVKCPECGREFYRNGLPRHMAIHKKKRGAA